MQPRQAAVGHDCGVCGFRITIDAKGDQIGTRPRRVARVNLSLFLGVPYATVDSLFIPY